MTIAYIAIGSNLASPQDQANAAITAMKKIPRSQLITVSSYYRTPPFGLLDQPDYLNAAVALETDLSAHVLLDNIQRIELQHGRKRKLQRWGPRTIDLDLMLFGDKTIHTTRLIVPHYDMRNRIFMLWPLVEIAPKLSFPNGETITSAIEHLNAEKPLIW